MSEQCKKKVFDKSGWHPYQCSRKAIKDGFCKQHHPESVKFRQDKSYAEYRVKMDNSPITLAIKRAEKAEQQCDALLLALKEACELIENSPKSEAKFLQLIAEIEDKS